MIFQDNVIKEYLKNVYFIAGTPCGGKTTISRALGDRYGIRVYDIDEQFPKHQQMSSSVYQPAMNKHFENADEFFGRSVEEYKSWLLCNTREQMDYVLLDLIRLSMNEPVICDCHITLEEARQLSEPSRVAFMIKETKDIVDEYCNRADHQGFNDFIHSVSDFEQAKAICNETLRILNTGHYQEIKKSEFFWLERDNKRSVQETANIVAQHFDFNK